MVKCPNCGSTAQVKVNAPTVSENGLYFSEVCKCGCGCTFELIYARNAHEKFVHNIEVERNTIK